MTKAKSEYMKKYREEKGDILRSYSRKYYKENKPYFKDYYKNKVANKRFVYMLEGKDNKILYIGSCKGKYRVKNHLQGNSQLELRGQDWVQLGIKKLIYADVTDITKDDAERYFIEKIYIQMHEPLLNSDNEPDPDLELERIESFIDLIYNDYIEFKEIDIKKAPHESKDFFNYNDLILS